MALCNDTSVFDLCGRPPLTSSSQMQKLTDEQVTLSAPEDVSGRLASIAESTTQSPASRWLTCHCLPSLMSESRLSAPDTLRCVTLGNRCSNRSATAKPHTHGASVHRQMLFLAHHYVTSGVTRDHVYEASAALAALWACTNELMWKGRRVVSEISLT
jgi:hypothetical protein